MLSSLRGQLNEKKQNGVVELVDIITSDNKPPRHSVIKSSKMIDLINEEDKQVRGDEEDTKRVRGDEEPLSVLPPTKKVKQQASLDPAPTAFTPYHLKDMSIKLLLVNPTDDNTTTNLGTYHINDFGIATVDVKLRLLVDYN